MTINHPSIFDIPECLDLIFSHPNLTKQDTLNAMLVSHCWAQQVARYHWATILPSEGRKLGESLMVLKSNNARYIHNLNSSDPRLIEQLVQSGNCAQLQDLTIDKPMKGLAEKLVQGNVGLKNLSLQNSRSFGFSEIGTILQSRFNRLFELKLHEVFLEDDSLVHILAKTRTLSRLEVKHCKVNVLKWESFSWKTNHLQSLSIEPLVDIKRTSQKRHFPVEFSPDLVELNFMAWEEVQGLADLPALFRNQLYKVAILNIGIEISDAEAEWALGDYVDRIMAQIFESATTTPLISLSILGSMFSIRAASALIQSHHGRSLQHFRIKNSFKIPDQVFWMIFDQCESLKTFDCATHISDIDILNFEDLTWACTNLEELSIEFSFGGTVKDKNSLDCHATYLFEQLARLVRLRSLTLAIHMNPWIDQTNQPKLLSRIMLLKHCSMLQQFTLRAVNWFPAQEQSIREWCEFEMPTCTTSLQFPPGSSQH